MASNTAETVFTGNADDLVAAYQQVREENRRQEEQLRELKRANREAHQEEKQNLRDAQRMMREVETPLETYRRKVEEIEKAYESGQIDQETYNRQLEKQKSLLEQNGSAADTFGGKLNAGVSRFVTQMAGFAAGLVSINAVIGAIRAEAEAFRQRNAQAALANTDFGVIMRNTRNMFTADDTVGDDDLLGRTLQAATDSRTSPKIIAEALAGVFSAKGQLSNEVALQAVTEAFRLTPNDLNAGSQLSARALDISKQSGVTDIPAIIGFLQNVTANARVTSVDAVGQYGVPAINAMTTRGDTLEQAGELFATLNQLMSDAEGRLTKTAAINLSSSLADLDMSGQPYAAVPEAQRAAFSAAGSTTARITVLQESEQLRAAVLKNVSFDAASSAFIEKLLSGTPDARATQQAAAAGIQGVTTPQEQAAQRAAFEAQVTRLDQSPDQALLIGKQRTAAAIESGQIQDVRRGRIGQVREQFEATLKEANLPLLDSVEEYLQLSRFDSGTARGESPETLAISGLTMLIDQVSRDDRAIFERQIQILQEQLEMQRAQQNRPADVVAAPQPPAAAQSR